MLFKKKRALSVTDERLDTVAIIMDGNGRWAKRRMLARSAGHVAGAANIRKVMDVFHELQIHNLILYAFSTENWKRPQEEVDGLMQLAVKYLDMAIDEMRRDDRFCFRIIGDTDMLSEAIRERIEIVKSMDRGQPYVCYVAINYGGRDEILHAANAAYRSGVTELTAEALEAQLYTAKAPHPDLLIRTGGDMRISNFLLWQLAYTELYFTKTLWPDFGRADIQKAVETFYGRHRRFGGL